MQDRLKYRIWDKSDECYINIDDCDMVFIEPNGKVTIGSYDGDIEDMRYFKEENIVVEFCIGKKDEKGKLIYEGDIVCVIEYGEYEYEEALRRKQNVEKISGMKVPAYNEPPFINKNHSQLIVWDNKRATFAMRDRINSTGRPESLYGKKYVVVGNINKNPELLEKK